MEVSIIDFLWFLSGAMMIKLLIDTPELSKIRKELQEIDKNLSLFLRSKEQQK